jgi:hypothetical protein
MMWRGAVITLLWLAGASVPAPAQEDFLSSGEVDAVRDAQEPDKRMILWMDLAQRRIDAVKQSVNTFKPQAGRAIQKSLAEYIHILEALDSTIQDARERRVPLSKGLKDVETRGTLFLNYLRTLNSEAIPGWKDFQFTLEEAIAMTRDELAEVAKGNYPELEERTPPTDLPSRPGAGTRTAPAEAPPQEEGPPRKSQQNR